LDKEKRKRKEKNPFNLSALAAAALPTTLVVAALATLTAALPVTLAVSALTAAALTAT